MCDVVLSFLTILVFPDDKSVAFLSDVTPSDHHKFSCVGWFFGFDGCVAADASLGKLQFIPT